MKTTYTDLEIKKTAASYLDCGFQQHIMKEWQPLFISLSRKTYPCGLVGQSVSVLHTKNSCPLQRPNYEMKSSNLCF